MNTELITQSWNAIGERRHEMITTFYERLFIRYPRYRRLFARDMSRQMQKMLETLARVAAQADAPSLVQPHLKKVGARHAPLPLTPRDFACFRFSADQKLIAVYNAELLPILPSCSWSPCANDRDRATGDDRIGGDEPCTNFPNTVPGTTPYSDE